MDKDKLLLLLPFLLLSFSFIIATKELVTLDEAEYALLYPKYLAPSFGAGHPGHAIPMWFLTNIFDPALTLKTVAFLTGMLTLYFTYKFTSKYLGELEGVMAIYLLVGLPLFWFHAIIGELYTPTALALVLSLYLSFEKRFYAAALSLGTAIAIQYAAVLAAIPFVYLLLKKAGRGEAIKAFLLSGLLPILSYGIWIQKYGFLNWARGVFPLGPWFFGGIYQMEAQTTAFMPRFIYNVFIVLITVNLVGLLALTSVTVYKKLNKEKKLLFNALVLMLLPLFLYPFMPLVDGYPFLVMIYPFLAMLAAISLSELVKHFKIKRYVWIGGLLLFLSLNLFIPPMAFLLTGLDHPTFDLVSKVNEIAEPESCVYSCLAGSGEEKFFWYYFPERKDCRYAGYSDHFYVTSNCASEVNGKKEVVESMHFDGVPYPWISKDYEIYRISS